jgi:hypothetical protein
MDHRVKEKSWVPGYQQGRSLSRSGGWERNNPGSSLWRK